MYAGFGIGGNYGIKAAVEDINKQGGIYVAEYDRKIPVKVISVNCESDPQKAGTLAEDLILSDKVSAFVCGADPPPMHAPVAIVAERYKTSYVMGTPMEPFQTLREAASPPWQYTWNHCLAIVVPPPEGDFRYGKLGYTCMDSWIGMLNLVADRTNKKAAIFASADSDGVAWYSLFPPVLEEYGIEVIGAEKKLGLFPMDTTDYTSMIKEWKDNDCEILWGNCPGPHFGTMWRQCQTLDYHPKVVVAVRAHLFYEEASAWGGDLPLGVAGDYWWSPNIDPEACPGIGGTTPMSLYARWSEDTGQPLNPNIAYGYSSTQILFDAIERAGTLDTEAVNKAIGETDLKTISEPRVVFDKGLQFSWSPLYFSQWQKTDQPWVWECPIIVSPHDFMPIEAEVVFPVP